MSEQNKIPCAVAQDLMPLVIDGAASEQSRQAVAQHVAACSACSQIYREMQSAAPTPVAQGKAEQGFRQAVKRQRKRFRAWKIAALCLGLVVAICLGTVVAKPELLLGFGQDVPLSWAQDLQLVRTTQGALLLQFTPAPQYKQHYGWRSLTSDQGEAAFTWRYPWIESVLGRTLQGDVTAVPSRIQSAGGKGRCPPECHRNVAAVRMFGGVQHDFHAGRPQKAVHIQRGKRRNPVVRRRNTGSL